MIYTEIIHPPAPNVEYVLKLCEYRDYYSTLRFAGLCHYPAGTCVIRKPYKHCYIHSPKGE